ncbi:hypothetical protein [Pseudomonas sp. D2002]|uniref:hypothetical protein n=1 Tax=Pseudomonas sp. D2002 TaxID=2726980 RepID=UPI0015A2AEEB|nr:hypothetical protein [Pseudomonas sp. D2002]NWA84427.1 hypothetical protein [Pseudomonas sp. D2002]
MSVSATTPSVSVSSSADTPQVDSKSHAKVNVTASTAPSYHSHNAGGVNFNASHSHNGPVFGQPQQAASHHNHFNNRPAQNPDFSAMMQQGSHQSSYHASHHASPQGGTQQHQQWANPWLGRPKPPTNAHGPYPITLDKPDPIYSKRSDDQLLTGILRDARAYGTPCNPSTFSRSAIEEMAQKELGRDPAMNRAIRSAKEAMRRPETMDAWFRQGDPASISDLRAFSQNPNPLKYLTDKQAVQELISHFNQLAGGFGKSEIDLDDLKYLAGLKRTGDSSFDHLRNVSERTVNSPRLTGILDELLSDSGDNKFSQAGLVLASYVIA